VAYYPSMLSTQDGLSLHFSRWEPEHDPRAVVYLIHGLGEHTGRYTHVAGALNQAGIACWGIDLRGHGRSEGRRGHTPSLERLLDDISLMIRENSQISPAFLYGHSLGATLALQFGRLRPEGLSGVVVSGAWLRLRFAPPRYKLALARILPKFAPGMMLANGLDVQALSRDESVVQAYVSDPLVHDRITAQLGAIMLTLADDLLSHPEGFRLPLLMMHGEQDGLTDPNATREFFEGVGSLDKTLKIWPGLFHEIHNEPEQAEVIRQMISWLEARLAPIPSH
jgi:alpha-beta hydrolase superfamily lysophospholipase